MSPGATQVGPCLTDTALVSCLALIDCHLLGRNMAGTRRAEIGPRSLPCAYYQYWQGSLHMVVVPEQFCHCSSFGVDDPS